MKKRFSLITLILSLACFLHGQQDISGTITDNNGEALIGANVLVKGTTVGTTVEIDGSFILSVPNGYNILQVSFTGFQSQEVDITGLSSIDITLSAGELLDEVIVVGYATSTKTKSSFSTATVNAETIEARPNASIAQTLQGQVAGLNIVTGSGQPGANSTINLRGVNSINGNTEPLFIVDGTPVDEDNFRSINPNEIESVSVLKDAGATAIYGNRGANGVIIVNTRRGDFGSGLKVTYSGLYGTNSLQGNDYSLLNGPDQLRLENQFGNGRGANLSDADINSAGTTDWVDFFFRSAFSQQHTLGISTGTETFTTHTSFGYSNQEGVLKTSDLQRYNIRNNLNVRTLDNKLNIGTTISLNYSRSNEPSNIGNGAINRNLVLGANQSVPYISPDDYIDGRTLLSPLSFVNTPLFLIDRLETFQRNENEIKFIGSINASYKILDNLTFSSTAGFDFTDEQRSTSEGPESFNSLLFAQTGNTTPGTQDQNAQRASAFNWFNSLSYDWNIGNGHSLNVAVYTEYFRAFYDQFGFRQNGLDPRTFSHGDGSGFIADNSANDFFIDVATSQRLEAGLFSYFGQLNYDYNSKFGLSGTLRRDASFRFSSSNRWGTFYSVAGRWNIDQEPFMRDGIFDLLKLRASYGVTGNQRIVDSGGLLNYFGGADLTEDFFQTGIGYGGQNAISLSQIGNTTLKWEEVSQFDVGLDFEINNSRLRGNLDFYFKETADLFQNRPVSAINAITALRANTGTLQNKGFDITLRYDVLRSTTNRGVNLTLNFLTNFNKQTIVDLPTPDGEVRNGAGNTILREGGPLNEYWVYPYLGVNPENGNLLFMNAEGEVTENPNPATDRITTGKNLFPDYQGSFGLSADYRNFYLDVQLNYTLGVDRFDFDYSGFINPNNIGQFRHSADILNAWTPENTDTPIPALTVSNRSLDASSDRFISSSDYLRVRFINFGYSFPSSTLETLGLTGLKLFVNAENLTTFTPWRGFDAEAQAAASRNYPTPRTISFGIEVGL